MPRSPQSMYGAGDAAVSAARRVDDTLPPSPSRGRAGCLADSLLVTELLDPSLPASSPAPDPSSLLTALREQVLERGEGLTRAQALACLQLPDDALPDLLQLAHEVRLRHCGPEVEVEGIISLKTGGCPEDCHFCSQSGLFPSPVRAAWLDIPSLVKAAQQTAATGATEFCIVAAVRGPDERLMAQVREGVAAIRAAVDIQVACSLGMLTQEQVDELTAMGVHRYNHNLETARSHFPAVVTTHTWEERFQTLRMVREAGMEVCCGGILGMGETLEQRAEFAAQLAELAPDEVPLNFLNPRPGTPFGDLPVMEANDALRAIATFRLALPRTILRFAGGREITLGDLARDGMLGGINAVIVGNYLTTLGRAATEDLDMLAELSMPIKALSRTI
jgi:biotin synthase